MDGLGGPRPPKFGRNRKSCPVPSASDTRSAGHPQRRHRPGTDADGVERHPPSPRSRLRAYQRGRITPLIHSPPAHPDRAPAGLPWAPSAPPARGLGLSRPRRARGGSMLCGTSPEECWFLKAKILIVGGGAMGTSVALSAASGVTRSEPVSSSRRARWGPARRGEPARSFTRGTVSAPRRDGADALVYSACTRPSATASATARRACWWSPGAARRPSRGSRRTWRCSASSRSTSSSSVRPRCAGCARGSRSVTMRWGPTSPTAATSSRARRSRPSRRSRAPRARPRGPASTSPRSSWRADARSASPPARGSSGRPTSSSPPGPGPRRSCVSSAWRLPCAWSAQRSTSWRCPTAGPRDVAAGRRHADDTRRAQARSPQLRPVATRYHHRSNDLSLLRAEAEAHPPRAHRFEGLPALERPRPGGVVNSRRARPRSTGACPSTRT